MSISPSATSNMQSPKNMFKVRRYVRFTPHASLLSLSGSRTSVCTCCAPVYRRLVEAFEVHAHALFNFNTGYARHCNRQTEV